MLYWWIIAAIFVLMDVLSLHRQAAAGLAANNGLAAILVARLGECSGDLGRGGISGILIGKSVFF